MMKLLALKIPMSEEILHRQQRISPASLSIERTERLRFAKSFRTVLACLYYFRTVIRVGAELRTYAILASVKSKNECIQPQNEVFHNFCNIS